MRLLWLTYERPPHRDAVCHPASDDELVFVLELLQRPLQERMRLAEQLINFLAEQTRRPALDRMSVACRMPSGLYRSVPWRLAKWLRHVLPAPQSVVERTIARIAHWRQQRTTGFEILTPNS